MGGCFSLSTSDGNSSASSANLITINGEFRQFSTPITVSEVLQQLETSQSSNSFICNSDCLYYDEHIPALNSDHQLQSGQIYFILPNSKLQYPLGSSDMAALAVKASRALSSQNNKQQRSKKARISPVLSMENQNRISLSSGSSKKKKGYSEGLEISRTGSMRKLQKYSSRRVKLAARSFSLRLTTIYEGSILLF